MRVFNLVIYLSVLLSANGYSQEPEKVLFIGNSFTYYWNLPTVVEEMAQFSNSNLEVYQSTLGGATLKQHWKGSRGLKTLDILGSQRFDKIVLQEHSTYPLQQRDTSELYFKKFINNEHVMNADVYLYATWLYPSIEKDNYGHKYPVENIIKNLAKGTNSSVLPVGRAFKMFREAYPEKIIFTDDNKHTNPNGTYLAACVIYGKLTGKSPIGLPHFFKSDENQGEKAIYYIIVRKDVAEICQKIADEVLNLTK